LNNYYECFALFKYSYREVFLTLNKYSHSYLLFDKQWS